ncbi:MAG: cell division ATP-binding protein FtsE [Oscillospiraceae bacterium]|jgi:cell division transport system ATP-binding protein|nr:cell division ATP-binding protein FtsE [Oscillospiraceae bacterium]
MIEFKKVSKEYSNGICAVKNINLNIQKGEFVFILGPSGAGKSTLLKLITREESPTSGDLIVNNMDVFFLKNRQIPYFRRTMGIVFQDFRLINKMTVFDNVAFAMRVTGASERAIRSRVPYVLSLVDLADKERFRPTELSGGEQQRVGLARALVNNPDLVIADEPTGNVDPSLSFEIVELLSKINHQGTTILMVTHEHDLVARFNKRIVEIQEGRIVSDVYEAKLANEA